MIFFPTCRYSDLGYTSVEAEVGGPFREWAKVLLVGGMALTLERIAPSIQCPAIFKHPAATRSFSSCPMSQRDHATRHPFAAFEAGDGRRYPVSSLTSAED
jgi:hypothetical protein